VISDVMTDAAGSVVEDLLSETGTIVEEALEGAAELVDGARRAGLRRLVALAVVIGAVVFAARWWQSRQPTPAVDQDN
jgi:hypothetical protein